MDKFERFSDIEKNKIKERLLNKKKLLGSKVGQLRKHLSSVYSYDCTDLPYKELVYLILTEPKHIPTCIFSGKKAFFLEYLNKYTEYSKEYYNIIRNDATIRFKPLSWQSLFSSGLSLKEAETCLVNKKYQASRTVFSKLENLDFKSFSEYLANLDFTLEFSKELYDLLFSKNIESINECVKLIDRATTIRNTEIEYWTSKGWTFEEATEKRKLFFRKGPAATEEKRKLDSNYNLFFIKSRSAGGHASQIKNGSCNKSKFEKELNESLLKKYKVRNFFSPCIDEDLKLKYNKYNFIHDFLIEDKFIIEYNGSYWHKDILFSEKFNKDDYLFEIKKAYNCIKQVKRKEKYSYILLWEIDFKSVDEAARFIENCMAHGNEDFYSSREIDLDLFLKYSNEKEKQIKNNSLFRDVALRFAEDSHCESRKVAAIAVKNNRIIATGINGTVQNNINCDDYFKYLHEERKIEVSYSDWIKTKEWREEHHAWSSLNEIHAEQNLIGEASKRGISLEGCDIYITLQPCPDCTKLLSSIGCKHVYYINEYDKGSTLFKEILNTSGVCIKKLDLDIGE